MTKTVGAWQRARADWALDYKTYLLRGLFGGPISFGLSWWLSPGHAMNQAVAAGLIGAVGGPVVISVVMFLWHLARAPFRLLNECRADLEDVKEAERRRQSSGEDARDLLLLAFDRHEDIWCTRAYVGTKNTSVAPVADALAYARWKAAVQELFKRGLIEPYGTNGCFPLTHSGNQRASELKRSQEGG